MLRFFTFLVTLTLSRAKCDRQLPCSTCVKRDIAAKCTYPPTRQPKRAGVSRPRAESSTGIRKRLDNLEHQIISLMETSAVSHPISLPDNTDQLSNMSLDSLCDILNKTGPSQQPNFKAGNLNTSTGAPSYVSSTHWVAILDSISEMKNEVQSESDNPSPHSDDSPARDPVEKPALLFGHQGSISREDVLAAMPPRPVVDRLVSEYFTDLDMMPHIACLHTPTFFRQYENFWSNPDSASIMWLGFLYSMMCLSAHFSPANMLAEPDVENTQTRTARPQYIDQVVQCLSLADYSRGGPYVIETLLHYFTIEHVRRPDTEVDTWLILGVILRLALRMGYHRDPAQFPKLSPIECEIRRRVWATLYILDIMVSMQIGVPKMVQEGQWDTRDPLNLSDEDFDENTTELPPSRGDDQQTPVFFIIARYKMAKVMGVMADIINATQYDPVKAAGAAGLLKATYDSLPSVLKLGSNGPNDHPRTIMHRYVLAIQLHQAEMLVHLRCMATPPQEDDFTRPDSSLNILLNAALKLLEYRGLLYQEAQPGGPLWLVRWKFSSTLAHEFLLATVVLSKALFSTLGPHPLVQAGTDMEVRILSTLRQTHELWLRSKHRSSEARQAADLLTSLFHALDPTPSMEPTNPDGSVIDLETYLGLNLDSLLPGWFLD
ncbi:fungal-specific transcription factor domain-containing protein [Fusarium solani]|uniref:Fungal-specific transcription factor domain-containing protein n=1 Tax=Fusarium solani TaxID=169388 RepID=A0A9P9GAS0_FUSSL|nr:fungal-specific transcription factor domain-containing protein [Fusarium solani]KAH7234489.1 fungal-specific transcription factor domain-containing protein [Fusarium solani]